MDVLEAIHSRRSVGRMTQEEPSREVIEKLLDAAVQAPNHHVTLPWRFFVMTGDARSRFGDAVAESLRPKLADLDEERREGVLADERRKPLRSPVLIAVGVRHDPEIKATPVEDLQACSAAIQNLLLAAHAEGLAAVWRTGSGAYADSVKAHFGLAPEDEIAGFVYLGYPNKDFVASMPPRQRSYAELTEWRN
ncbi:MAG: nitroreductase [Dehalococcoidia bacterium]